MVKCSKCGLLKDSFVRVGNGNEPVCLWTKEKIGSFVEERKCRHYFTKIPDLSPEAHYKMKFDEKQTNKTFWIAIISIIIALLSLFISFLNT